MKRAPYLLFAILATLAVFLELGPWGDSKRLSRKIDEIRERV